MTSIPVSNAAKNVQTVAKTQGAASFTNSQKTSESFQDAMSMFGVQVAQDLQSGASVKGAETSDVYAKAQAGRKQLENKPQEKLLEEEKLSDEAIGKIEAAGEKAVQKIAKELGVSEEDVEKALEELGLTVFDLSNANNMTLLMMQILNITDSMVMLTDSNLFETMTMLTQTVESLIEEVAGELSMPVEDLLMQLESMKQETVTSVEITKGENDQNDFAQSMQDVTDTVESNISTKESALDEQQSGVKKEMQFGSAKVQEQDGETELNKNDSSAEMGQTASEHSAGKENTNAQTMLNQNNYTTFSNATEQVFANQNVSQSSYGMNMFDSIMNQIGNYVDVYVTPDMTKMEIALTPENLGNVHIQIASKNGAITAQIATENEVVKQAMEMQVVQLKERLESQGIKIEAVEVTVASHEFERNLDENNQNREQEAEVKKVARKKWNLSDFEEGLEETDELTETEKVELDMMKLSGNQLNYTV